jgi:septum formation inhibitor-activating ATPase MinD
MYARVVRFNGVTQEGIDHVLAEIEKSDGPPPGVEAARMQMLYDADQQTSLFVAYFETAEAMQAADRVFGAMDASDTPGERASVDMAEVVIEREG